jgi:lipopolysaccharide export LptBFGC system permease protein LptF
MSRTLFFYIFKDLLKIFMYSSGALAGIMSFGGLLRPLTEHGLDASQAASMLGYFMPAMMTYSLPIAALFATTVVYGRLAADNEITACRAVGLSYISIAMPAVVLGLVVALVSLFFLCFVVPLATLKVERVIYSNIAQLIANQIERTHQIKFPSGGGGNSGDMTIFAQDAAVAPQEDPKSKEQVVSLGGLMIVSYRKAPSQVANTPDVSVPKEFYLAKRATVRIVRGANEEFTLHAMLDEPGGAMFPRAFEGDNAMQGGLQATEYGPVPIPSPVQEEVKFMDIRRLHELYGDLSKSRRVQEQVQKLIRTAQQLEYLKSIQAALADPGGTFHFDAGNEQYDLVAERGRDSVQLRAGRLHIEPARLVQTTRDGKTLFSWNAAEIQVDAEPAPGEVMSIRAQLREVIAQTPEGPDARPSFTRTISVQMPSDIKQIESNTLDSYLRNTSKVSQDERTQLRRAMYRIGNGIQSELHSRCSFALSCLILVIVGCALGMMFKSGNYLTAFALSVIPALVCIALIVAGQHTCENIPWKIDANFKNPLSLGLALIWSGNAMVLAIAAALGWRLQRQ